MTEKADTRKRTRHFNIKPRYTMAAAGVVLIAAMVTVLIMKSQPAQPIDNSKYQVVYLSNGQAYFGKLQNVSGEFLVIKSPYIAQSVANSEDKTNTNSTQTTLLRVTDQVYGPEDSIAIKTSQVTFWQNLRDDSKFTQAIKSKE